ncbi:MAG: hypothetical protein ABI199_09090 [Bacteroidia bacterium]
MNEKMPSVTLKRKNISALIEYCLDNKIDMSVKAQAIQQDEFDIEFTSLDTKKAILLGMCLRDLRLELNGLNTLMPSKVAKKTIPAKEIPVSKKAENNGALAFEENLEFNLEGAN